MFVHIWRMRARKKRSKDYENFGQQVTLAAFKKLDGCQDAYLIKVNESRKPEYLWLVFWRDQKAFDAARTSPAWREQRRKFESGKFYKMIPRELVCECLASFSGSPPQKAKPAVKPTKPSMTKKKVERSTRPATVKAARPVSSPVATTESVATNKDRGGPGIPARIRGQNAAV